MWVTTLFWKKPSKVGKIVGFFKWVLLKKPRWVKPGHPLWCQPCMTPTAFLLDKNSLKLRCGAAGCKTQTTPARKRSRRKAQKKKGRAEAQPTSPGKQKYRPPVTWKPQGNQQQGKQRTPQALRKSTQQVPFNQNPGGDQQTGVRQANSPVKGAEPLRGSSRRGSCARTRKKHKGGNRTSVPRQPQLHAKPSPQE